MAAQNCESLDLRPSESLAVGRLLASSIAVIHCRLHCHQMMNSFWASLAVPDHCTDASSYRQPHPSLHSVATLDPLSEHRVPP